MILVVTLGVTELLHHDGKSSAVKSLSHQLDLPLLLVILVDPVVVVTVVQWWGDDEKFNGWDSTSAKSRNDLHRRMSFTLTLAVNSFMLTFRLTLLDLESLLVMLLGKIDGGLILVVNGRYLMRNLENPLLENVMFRLSWKKDTRFEWELSARKSLSIRGFWPIGTSWEVIVNSKSNQYISVGSSVWSISIKREHLKFLEENGAKMINELKFEPVYLTRKQYIYTGPD